MSSSRSAVPEPRRTPMALALSVCALLAAPALAQAPPAPPRLPVDARAMYPHLETVEGADRPQDPPAPPSADARFAEALAYAKAQDTAALLIWQGGRLRVEHYADGATRESRPEPASMHKTVMALAVGAALESGAIASLDDSVSRYLPEWADDPRGAITLRQALQMSSGLAAPAAAGDGASLLRSQDLRADVLALSRASEPGRSFRYMNANSQLACLALQAATGRRYADHLSRAIWRPIGAADAYLTLDRADGQPRCFSSLLARPIDWMRVGLLIKDEGRVGGQRVVRPDWIAAMTTPSPANPNYGFQTWLGEPYAAQRWYNADRTGYSVRASAPYLAKDMVLLDGFGGQRVYVSRAWDLVIVRLGQPAMAWDDAALPNAVVAALQRDGVTGLRSPRG